MNSMSPSRLAVEALGLKPLGIPAKAPTTCSMCGFTIHEGDMHVRTDFGQNFMDDTSLAARTGMACGFCAVTKTADALRTMQKAVFTKEGAFPLAKDIHRAWLFLTPPEPPFVAVVSDAMQQHLVWRTPVTWSKDLIIVRLGQRLLRIRRPVLLKAVEAAAELMLADEKNAASKNPARHPYALLSREMGELAHGLVRADFIGRMPPILLSLTPGELWAMATIAKRDTPSPEKPEPITMQPQS